ncbi:transposase [Streptomyces syringium]|uniref:transposase n=1 Tax=Streptomyces syringium TaxID=76729 RepID=UPI0033CCEB6D
MGSKDTKRYSEEYKRDAIELVRSSGRTVPEVARELGVAAGLGEEGKRAQDSGSGPGRAVCRRPGRRAEAAAEVDRRAGEDVEILKKRLPSS